MGVTGSMREWKNVIFIKKDKSPKLFLTFLIFYDQQTGALSVCSLNWSCSQGHSWICTNLHFSKNFIATFLWGFWSFLFFFFWNFWITKMTRARSGYRSRGQSRKIWKISETLSDQLWPSRFYELFLHGNYYDEHIK